MGEVISTFVYSLLVLRTIFDREATAIQASSSNYVQAIDTNQLMQIATKANILLQLQRRPRDFVIKGSPLVLV